MGFQNRLWNGGSGLVEVRYKKQNGKEKYKGQSVFLQDIIQCNFYSSMRFESQATGTTHTHTEHLTVHDEDSKPLEVIINIL